MSISAIDSRKSSSRLVESAVSVRIVRGRKAVLDLQAMLNELSEQCGQSGAMEDLRYFLPRGKKKIPCVVLVSETCDLRHIALGEIRQSDLTGAVLLCEYCLYGLGLRIYMTDDRIGLRTVVAAERLRVRVASFACEGLMAAGAQMVLMCYRDAPGSSTWMELLGENPQSALKNIWGRRERDLPDYLALEETFDGTLATIGQRTRSNLRYYRRRAERDLGCSFLPSMEIGRGEFFAFNARCKYALPGRIAWDRYVATREVPTHFVAGTRAADGRWLSLIGGRRQGTNTQILWQMNRKDLPAYSLGTVIRSYLIEHEVARGASRVSIEGGTPHAMRFSFVRQTVIDLAVVRRSPMALAIKRYGWRAVPQENTLFHMLNAPNVEWRR